MSKIKIQNFGPIKAGCTENDGWIDIKKVTLFIGNQGSGKSTVAKLISTLMWLEKAMVKGIIRHNDVETKIKFEQRLDYLKLKNYLHEETEIYYQGNAFGFQYKNGMLNVTKNDENGYLLPKIMYVPAERSFLSVIDRPDKLKDLPAALYTFNDEYDGAKAEFSSGFDLPVNNMKFVYDKSHKLAHIQGSSDGFKLRLSEASSGFQSMVPLILVTKYLAEGYYSKEDISKKENSLQEQRQLEKDIKSILDDKTLSSDVKHVLLRQLSEKRKPACFVNIVEEPELNLFPKSQKDVLFNLIQYANKDEGNKLIMTTHSPYFINYLTLLVKAYKVQINANDSAAIEKIEAIVPIASALKPDDLIIYQFDEVNGTISPLETYKGLPSDENYLNDSLGETNELFAKLLEIEKGWQ